MHGAVPFVRRALLPFTVFVTGGCVLVIEVVATRILAPYFGNTIYSVSSVISVVLAALSLGYYIGGRLADRYPTKKAFFGLITASGLAVLAMQLLQGQLLEMLGYALPLTIGPLIVATILFFLPSFILGTLSPFAIAVQQQERKKQGVGTTAGTIFFFSTTGSIVGSLLTGFVLVPTFGVSGIVAGVGVVLLLLGLVPLVVMGLGRRMLVLLVLAAADILLVGELGAPAFRVVYSHDGVYEKITISDGVYYGHPARFLKQDTSHSAAIYLDSDALPYEYTRYYQLQELFVPKLERALVLGGGAYSVPKGLLQDSPTVLVDAAEIEPSLPGLAKQYFGLKDDPRLTHYIADGRRMLHDTKHRYDLIFSDVYHSMYSVPAHFTTREFMQLAHDRLRPGGVFIANLIGSLKTGDESFIWSEVKTMQQVFPQVYLFAVYSPTETVAQNIIVVGSMESKRLEFDPRALAAAKSQVVRTAAGHYVDTVHVSLAPYSVLTDDYAPVDYLTAKVLPKHR
jgi:spermidine synthase